MHLLLLTLVIVARLALGVSSSHAAVPAGFQETVVTSVSQPSVIGFAPDGRLFIGEKASGRIRIYKNGALLAQPFVDVNAFVPAGTYFDTFNERGLLGMAFDPSFATNGFLYVYYSVCKAPANPPQPGTNTCGSAKNRVVRFTAAGDVVDATSPVVLLDDIDNDGGNHNAGWVGFGPLDGKLYVAIGDGGSFSAKAQDMGSLNGKILRLNADGTIPADNPFVTQAGARGEIWALGVRNPFRCRFATDGRLFCGDVGANGWEEVDLVTKGANYGWPTTEGPFNATSFPQFTAPIHAYAHSTSVAIIGGDFGAKTSFPGDYQQSYFFGDFAIGRIQRALLSPSGTTVQSIQDFATSLGGNSVTDLIAGPDGSLYYTAYGANQVWRITATSTNRSPVAVASADVTSGPPPLLVHFSATGSSDPDGDPITYSWSFGDGSATSALASPSHQFAVKGTYTVTLTVSDGKATPGPGTATLVIAVGAPPMASIAAPLDGASFRAGDTIPLQGSASDSEDGVLPASSLHWRVIFHHADHYHPYIDDLPGSASSFTTATSGEPDSDVAYEIFLTATDSSGLSNTTSVVIVPVTSDFTLQTSPAGLGVTLDGQPKTAPVTTTGVVGLRRVIGAPPVQTVGAATYYFAGWSDGGLPTHEIVTPELDATFSASFMPPATCGAPVVLPAQGGTFTTATSGGSNQSGTCSTSTNSPEQVFQWTPAASGTATIATCGGATSFDTVLYVRSGTCATGTQVACADDATGCGTTEPNDHHASRASLGVTAGQTYFIVVDGFDGANGTFTLTVTPPSGVAPTATRTATPVRTATPTTTAVATASATRTATPLATPSPTVTPLPPTATRTSTPVPTVTSQPVATASPGPCNPIPVPPEGGTFTGTTSGTSAFAGTCAVTGASPDRVYQWTPATSGTAIVATCGATSFDTALYVRSGSCQGTQVACNDDTAGCGTSEPNDHHASRATLAVTAGQTYFIVVDGYNGASGNYTLTITPPSGPTTTRAATPTATVTPTLAATSTATTTVVPTKTATTTPAPTAPTATATIVPTATRTATPVPSGTPTPLPSPTRTTTRTPTPTATPPPDACSSVTLVPAEGGIFNASTAGSSTQAGSCGVTDKSGERIFQWTPAVSGAATIGTCGTATRFDTVLYLRSATCGGAETICVDDAAGCATGEPNDHHGSRIGPVVTAGQDVFHRRRRLQRRERRLQPDDRAADGTDGDRQRDRDGRGHADGHANADPGADRDQRTDGERDHDRPPGRDQHAGPELDADPDGGRDTRDGRVRRPHAPPARRRDLRGRHHRHQHPERIVRAHQQGAGAGVPVDARGVGYRHLLDLRDRHDLRHRRLSARRHLRRPRARVQRRHGGLRHGRAEHVPRVAHQPHRDGGSDLFHRGRRLRHGGGGLRAHGGGADRRDRDADTHRDGDCDRDPDHRPGNGHPCGHRNAHRDRDPDDDPTADHHAARDLDPAGDRQRLSDAARDRRPRSVRCDGRAARGRDLHRHDERSQRTAWDVRSQRQGPRGGLPVDADRVGPCHDLDLRQRDALRHRVVRAHRKLRGPRARLQRRHGRVHHRGAERVPRFASIPDGHSRADLLHRGRRLQRRPGVLQLERDPAPMSPRTILCVFGTRPEAIKMAPVVRALSARVDEFRPVVCVTNQHQEMLDQVLDLFELRAEHSLQVMTSGQTPNDVTVRVLERLPPVLASTKPAAVLVQGDTTTTFAAALAAFYARIPIGHVEAGLRTYRKDSPFPEELNRQMTTVLADWHYAPTAWARDNLLRAGVAPETVTVTGNPVTDALHWIADQVGDGADVVPSLRAGSRMILVTAHRRENFGAPFVDMCEAMRTLVERHPDVELVYPVHLNPNVQEPVRRILAGLERVHLLAPVDYATLVALLKRCDLVLTDSGGIQEEAPSLGKPVLVMRDTTERPEGIEAGTAKLVGTARDHIIAETERLLDDPAAYASMAHAHNPYGDGHAGECIAETLAAALAAPPKMGS